jgi:hypothetical protein
MSWRFDSLFLQGIRLCVFPYRSDKEIPNRCWVNIVDDQVEHIVSPSRAARAAWYAPAQ